METKIIELGQGDSAIRVEVEKKGGRTDFGAGDRLPDFETQIYPILLEVSESIVNVFDKVNKSFDKVNKSIDIPEAEVTLNLGFEAEGNVFIAKGKTTASLSVTLKINNKENTKTSSPND